MTVLLKDEEVGFDGCLYPEIDFTDSENAEQHKVLDSFGFALGEAAWWELRIRLISGIHRAREHHDPTRPYLPFLKSVLRQERVEFIREYSMSNLKRERDDLDWRIAALQSDESLCNYLNYVEDRVKTLQKFYPRRMYVPELSPEDFRREAVYEILLVLRNWDFGKFEKTGKEATIVAVYRLRDRLRERRRTNNPIDDTPQFDFPSPEQLYIENEQYNETLEILNKVQQRLSRGQLSWFDAFYSDCRENRKLSLSRTAKKLGRDKSNATRTMKIFRNIASNLGG